MSKILNNLFKNYETALISNKKQFLRFQSSKPFYLYKDRKLERNL